MSFFVEEEFIYPKKIDIGFCRVCREKHHAGGVAHQRQLIFTGTHAEAIAVGAWLHLALEAHHQAQIAEAHKGLRAVFSAGGLQLVGAELLTDLRQQAIQIAAGGGVFPVIVVQPLLRGDLVPGVFQTVLNIDAVALLLAAAAKTALDGLARTDAVERNFLLFRGGAPSFFKSTKPSAAAFLARARFLCSSSVGVCSRVP